MSGLEEDDEDDGALLELLALLLVPLVLDEGVVDEGVVEDELLAGVVEVLGVFDVSYWSDFLLRVLLLQPANPKTTATSADAVMTFSFLAFMFRR